MTQDYIKTYYDYDGGYRLHHTIGASAEASTLPYLHSNTSFMLICFLQGNGNIKIEGRSYEVAPGDIILLNPGELYHCTVYGQTCHERLVLYADETILRNFSGGGKELFHILLRRERGIGNLISAKEAAENKLSGYLQELFELAKNADGISQMLSVCKVIEILASVSRLITSQTAKLTEGYSRTGSNPLILQVLEYISDNFKEELNIPKLATYFGLHPSRLSHLFKEYVGIPLWNYVIYRRFDFVNELLLNGCSAEQACYEAGFKNYSNFYRLYKKYMKVTPQEYKKSRQGVGNLKQELVNFNEEYEFT